MIYLVYERATGIVLSSIVADAPPTVLSHHDSIEVTEVPDFRTVRVVDGEVVPYADSRYLESYRRKVLARIDDARDARLAAGADTPHGIVQADIASRINISGAVNLALLDPTNFEITWRLADNSGVALNAPAMIAVGQAVGAFVSSTYAQSFALKDEVANLDSVDELREFAIVFE